MKPENLKKKATSPLDKALEIAKTKHSNLEPGFVEFLIMDIEESRERSGVDSPGHANYYLHSLERLLECEVDRFNELFDSWNAEQHAAEIGIKMRGKAGRPFKASIDETKVTTGGTPGRGEARKSGNFSTKYRWATG